MKNINNEQPEEFEVYNQSKLKREIADSLYEDSDLKYAYADDTVVGTKVFSGMKFYRHKYHKDIIFNYVYKNNNQYCSDTHFYIVKVYTTKKKDFVDESDRYTWVIVRFIESLSTITVPYCVFRCLNIYDPYHPMFNGYCCIGNISIRDNIDYYNAWLEIMKRLFDPLYKLFKYFGGNGVRLRFERMACFENFVAINNNCIRCGQLPFTDPNDPELYIGSIYTGEPFAPYGKFGINTNSNIAVLNRMPFHETIREDFTIPMELKRMAFEDRSVNLKPRATGRPKGVKNKSHKMYKLIDPNK